MQSSVLALLDFSKVYNAFWREKLLLHILDMDILATIICWLCSFLNNLRAQVQILNVHSSSSRFQQGLSQGSVLTPLLFLFYINDLVNKLYEEAVVAMIADDLSILITARNKVDAERLAQAEVDIISQKIRQWKIQPNAGNSKVCALCT